jgi:uncharacterized protein (UPF0332 family)
MSYTDKVAENKRIAKKCMEMKAYNAGVTRAYYAAFLQVKAYLIGKQFDYKKFLLQRGSKDREFSHGTIQAAIVTCLLANGKEAADVYKLNVLGSMYNKRRIADYKEESVIECELESSLKDLDIVLSVVA